MTYERAENGRSARTGRAEWGNVPSMSYVSNFASVVRKNARNYNTCARARTCNICRTLVQG